MPSVRGKGSGGRRNEQAARNGKRVGAPQKYITLRIPLASGRVPIAIDNDAAALAAGLLLHFPECGSVEGLISEAVRRLAETMDD